MSEVGALAAAESDAAPEERELVRREMAAELADWIRAQCVGVGYTRAGAWQQIADKIDPRKVPSRNGLRSFWNQGETW